jgi:hypothetical protein
MACVVLEPALAGLGRPALFSFLVVPEAPGALVILRSAWSAEGMAFLPEPAAWLAIPPIPG